MGGFWGGGGCVWTKWLFLWNDEQNVDKKQYQNQVSLGPKTSQIRQGFDELFYPSYSTRGFIESIWYLKFMYVLQIFNHYRNLIT